ncbi:DUF1488 domain-containing protein [Hoeflea sp. WL0058]|uniref:DUF1488 domain-containing protein n=1 Tax=Flavimaribacter sediminis TaxID=2865987 RepID=A0AAE2ZJ19_9HYPH|nr:DUF1488 domain-containing protein [Flavimaribacter sediminis]MBW8635866.1 DUF1488 domain-containing protein [Flavimaribacter sediminis]
MTLAFPNSSRSYDRTRNAVRFVGHDGMFEVAFLIEAEALGKHGGGLLSETDCLTAFDSSLASIHRAACKAYSRGRKTLCILKAVDFRG